MGTHSGYIVNYRGHGSADYRFLETFHGLNSAVIGHGNFYIHFSEVTAAQEVTDGVICSVLGVACFVAFIVLARGWVLLCYNYIFEVNRCLRWLNFGGMFEFFYKVVKEMLKSSYERINRSCFHKSYILIV